MTPEKLRQMAAELDAKAEEALRAGKEAEADLLIHAAWKARDLAEQRERDLATRRTGLPGRNNPRIMSGKNVTASQLKRRGAAVARGWAARGGSPVSKAITDSKHKTLTAYAAHLKISQPALSRYISGDLPCPRFVAKAVKDDFDLDDRVWPKGVVD